MDFTSFNPSYGLCYARAVTNYRRNFICGGSFFFAANLAERRLRLLVDTIVSAKDDGFRCRSTHPTGYGLSCGVLASLYDAVNDEVDGVLASHILPAEKPCGGAQFLEEYGHKNLRA